MKYLSYIFIALVAGLLFYLGIFSGERLRPNNDQRIKENLNTSQGPWETKIDDQPSVYLTVTPIEFGKDVPIWKFDITFETHSGSLDQDPMKVISLLDGKGKIYQPIAWEGSGPGGHHREGVLIFNAINPEPPYVELKIKNVGGIPERSFKWDLE